MLAMTAFGCQAVSATPDGGRAVGIWPVALATSALMLAGPPARTLLAPLVGVLAVASLLVGGRPLEVAVWLGVGLGLEALVTWRVLTRGRPGRASLATSGDLARFLGAVGAGALAAASVAAVASLVTGWGDPGLLALSVGSSGVAAQVSLLPFFCRFRDHPPLAGPVERSAQWAALLAVTLAVFVSPDMPSLVMLTLPALMWGALRNGSNESMAQVAVVFALTMVLTTYGVGPFARPDLRSGLPVDLQGVLLATFGAVCALVALVVSMTVGEQREGAAQVAAERDRVRAIVDGVTPVAIIGGDLRGRITLFNRGAERLLGYSEREVRGLSTRILHPPESVAAKAAELGVAHDFAAVAQALAGAGPTEMSFRRRDGVVRVHEMTLNHVRDDRGRPTGFVSTSEDVTDRLEAEARLVAALATEREAVERLQEVDRVKDAFVSSVSHELRTPLTSILGYLEVLTDGGYGSLEPHQLEVLSRIRANSDRLLALISELLTLSHVEDRGADAVTEPVDLLAVVETAAGVLAPVAERREVRLELEVACEARRARPHVLGDLHQLERVVLNLGDNAVKFTPPGGRVDLRLDFGADAGDAGDAGDDVCVITVRDTGIGVPRHEQDRLFDRFFRSSLAQLHAVPGSGLGLSIAAGVVAQHGGTISVASEAGEGSTFTVRLPRLRTARTTVGPSYAGREVAP
nr:ATP-binding protein [Nocardioides flavescens]